MGLDMYLTKETGVKNYSFTPEERKIEISLKIGGVEKDTDRIAEIVEEVGYWRKANQIHNWFVKNVQGGKDDCGKYLVDSEDFANLKQVCQKILYLKESGGKFVEFINEHLPPTSGFFFGSTDIDEWYFSDLEQTILILEELENDSEDVLDAEYYYRASW